MVNLFYLMEEYLPIRCKYIAKDEVKLQLGDRRFPVFTWLVD
jgi:hypothetical protein